MKAYLPSSYFNAPTLVFVNEMGEEKTLKVNVNESMTDREHNGNSYTSEHFEIIIYDETNLFFQIVLIGDPNYSQEGHVVTSLLGILMPFNESGTTSSTVFFQENSPVVSFGDDFREEITFNGIAYNDVYIQVGLNMNVPYDSYSELDINSDYGVVAFKDHNNDVWSILRIE